MDLVGLTVSALIIRDFALPNAPMAYEVIYWLAGP